MQERERNSKKQAGMKKCVCMKMHFKLYPVLYVNSMLYKNVFHVVINNMKIDNFVITIRQLKMKFMWFLHGTLFDAFFVHEKRETTSSWCNLNLISLDVFIKFPFIPLTSMTNNNFLLEKFMLPCFDLKFLKIFFKLLLLGAKKLSKELLNIPDMEIEIEIKKRFVKSSTQCQYLNLML